MQSDDCPELGLAFADMTTCLVKQQSPTPALCARWVITSTGLHSAMLPSLYARFGAVLPATGVQPR